MDQHSGGQIARSTPGAIGNLVSPLDELLAGLLGGDEARAEEAVTALAEQGAEALPALLNLLDSSPDVEQRWWILRALAENPQAESHYFVPYLSDPAEEIRQCAALALAAHPGPEAVPALIQALSDADELTAMLSARALVALGSEAVAPLLEVQKDAPLSARIQAMRALSEIGDERAIPAMLSALEEASVFLRHWAEFGLERLGLNMVYFKPE